MFITGTASTSAAQLRCNSIAHTIPSDNESSVALACILLINFACSMTCVVHALALCMNLVLMGSSTWQLYLHHINKDTSYFNCLETENVHFSEKQNKKLESQTTAFIVSKMMW